MLGCKGISKATLWGASQEVLRNKTSGNPAKDTFENKESKF
jgi:hypothetical protein